MGDACSADACIWMMLVLSCCTSPDPESLFGNIRVGRSWRITPPFELQRSVSRTKETNAMPLTWHCFKAASPFGLLTQSRAYKDGRRVSIFPDHIMASCIIRVFRKARCSHWQTTPDQQHPSLPGLTTELEDSRKFSLNLVCVLFFLKPWDY